MLSCADENNVVLSLKNGFTIYLDVEYNEQHKTTVKASCFDPNVEEPVDMKSFTDTEELIDWLNAKRTWQSCPYCGGNCPNDSEHMCDQFSGTQQPRRKWLLLETDCAGGIERKEFKVYSELLKHLTNEHYEQGVCSWTVVTSGYEGIFCQEEIDKAVQFLRS